MTEITPTAGTAGIPDQLPGTAATVSNLAAASGNIAPGNLVEPDIDDELFKFQSEDTALMSMMLKARKVKVQSPEVQHYVIDEQRSTVSTSAAVSSGSGQQFTLPLGVDDQQIVHVHHTLLVQGVNGYAPDGSTVTYGQDLMLYVVGTDTSTGNPVVKAINGPKNRPSDPYCVTPAIAADSKIKVLANAMYETQKEVDPDMVVPVPATVYLQKRGMNQVVSDYFDAQRKRIPFSQSVIAEQAILNFKRAGNRTLWAGRKGKIAYNVPKLGEQMVYFTEGLRWQFPRELRKNGRWTVAKIMALAKIFFTGEDVPKSATLLAGKNLLEELQYIDFSAHPEIQVLAAHNPLGWAVTRVHTVFGDIDIKREPTLDALGWSNSGALIANDRLVHYTYASQHEFNDRIEGEEASRRGMVVWDGLALKGACHIWINGEGTEAAAPSEIIIWDGTSAPSGSGMVLDAKYYLLNDIAAISPRAKVGTMWTNDGEGWTQV